MYAPAPTLRGSQQPAPEHVDAFTHAGKPRAAGRCVRVDAEIVRHLDVQQVVVRVDANQNGCSCGMSDGIRDRLLDDAVARLGHGRGDDLDGAIDLRIDVDAGGSGSATRAGRSVKVRVGA
jgi:hypothetical protein